MRAPLMNRTARRRGGADLPQPDPPLSDQHSSGMASRLADTMPT
jgi:hypothetical protein